MPRIRPMLRLLLPAVTLFAPGCHEPAPQHAPTSTTSPDADERPARPIDKLATAPLHTFNERELDAYLKSLAAGKLSVADRAAFFAERTIGQPYRLSLLGEFPFELMDDDPLYDLSASDCVTFVENNYAMAMSNDWHSFFARLMHLRYKDGRIGMLTRNHFTEADWNPNNAWAFDDVTDRLAPGSTWPMTVLVDRAAFFKNYGMGGDIPVQRFETAAIRREQFGRVYAKLQPGDVVEFIRGTPEAPYVGHLGLIGRREAGRVVLIHSTKPRVRKLPLRDYIDEHANIIGIKVLRCRIQSPSAS